MTSELALKSRNLDSRQESSRKEPRYIVTLVGRLKRWQDLGRLRRQTRREPSPSAFAELAERLISLGEHDDALRVAEEGLAAYPHADRLEHVRLYVKKSRMTGELRRLREEIQRRPTALGYSRLAKLYRELGSHDEALAIASVCAERFPTDETAFLLQADLRRERFRSDKVAKDAIMAESALRQALRLNPHNVDARVRLAELCHLVGLREACAEHLLAARQASPSSPDLEALVRELGDAPASDEESFAEMAERVQAQGAFAGDPSKFDGGADDAEDAGADDVDPGRLIAAMSVFAGHEGLRNVVVLGRQGVVVADHSGKNGLARGPFAQLVAEIRDAADDASRRMDTGALARADVEGPGGSLVVTRVQGLTIGMQYAEPMRADRAWGILQDFTARQLGAGREPSRA
jgi:tetratricopeptide (TPR) repeat protein